MNIVHKISLAAGLATAPVAALAQSDASVQTSVSAQPDASLRDTLTIGAGPTIIPRFEGSDDYTLVPNGAIRGSVSRIGFSTVGTALFVDLVPQVALGTKLVFGPMAHATLNRSSLRQVRDPRVVALGKVPIAIDVGGHVGLSCTGVFTSDFDSLSVDLAVSHDISGIHDSLIVTPSVNYGTPLSRKLYVGLSASTTHVGQGYMQRYVGVTAAQSRASGLRAYTPTEGFKDATFGVLANASITGDLRHGLSAFAIGSYSKLLGAFGRSPVVRDRNQFFAGLGLGYTF